MKLAPEYYAWRDIRLRCTSSTHKNFPRYGGRGIYVCNRWLDSYSNFLADMGGRPSPLHSIDRINNDGPYSPENCRWATRAEQTRNRSSNRLMTLNGRTQCIVQWAEELGIKANTLNSRIVMGWSDEKTLTTPVKVKRCNTI